MFEWIESPGLEVIIWLSVRSPDSLMALAFPGIKSQIPRTTCKQTLVFESRATQVSSFSGKHDSPGFPLHERGNVAAALDAETG